MKHVKAVWALYRMYLENVILKIPQGLKLKEVDIFQFDSIRGEWISFIEKYNSRDDILLDKTKTHPSLVYLVDSIFSCPHSNRRNLSCNEYLRKFPRKLQILMCNTHIVYIFIENLFQTNKKDWTKLSFVTRLFQSGYLDFKECM